MTRADLAAVSLPLVILVPASADSGGFFPTSWGWLALALLGVCALAALLTPGFALERRELAMLAGTASLAALVLVSVLWSVDPTQTVLAAERMVVYPIGLAAVLLVVRRSSLGWLMAGLVATTTLVAVVSLATKVVPGVFGGQSDPLAHGQLYFPIGYWNCLGCLLAIGLVLAGGLAFLGEPRFRRTLVASATVQAAALLLTQSRGALIAAAIGGLVCLVLYRPPRRLIPGGVAALVGLVVVVSMLGPAGTALAAHQHGKAGSETVPLTGRGALWTVSLKEFEAHPLLGSGAGTWNAFWSRLRPYGHNVGNPHSLYMEALGELGIVGLALVLGTLAVPLVEAFRRLGAIRSPLLPVAAGAYAALCVHSAVDWDWECPAVALLGLWCGAAVLIALRRPGDPADAPEEVHRFGLVGICALLAVPVTVGLVGNSLIADSAAAYASARYAAADRDARDAAAWMPWSYEPATWQGEAELRDQQPAAAAAAFRKGLAKPRADGVWRLWWNVARATGGQQQIAALRNVVALNPHSPELRSLCQSVAALPATEPLLAGFCRTLPRKHPRRAPS